MIWLIRIWIITAMISYGLHLSFFNGEIRPALIVTLTGPIGLVTIINVSIRKRKFYGFRLW